jgi:hypothetical protein
LSAVKLKDKLSLFVFSYSSSAIATAVPHISTSFVETCFSYTNYGRYTARRSIGDILQGGCYAAPHMVDMLLLG